LSIRTLGLINMTGRIYDPALRRFLTPDPFVQAPLFSQSHNPYSYVWNNPATLIDPTGTQSVRSESGDEYRWEPSEEGGAYVPSRGFGEGLGEVIEITGPAPSSDDDNATDTLSTGRGIGLLDIAAHPEAFLSEPALTHQEWDWLRTHHPAEAKSLYDWQSARYKDRMEADRRAKEAKFYAMLGPLKLGGDLYMRYVLGNILPGGRIAMMIIDPPSPLEERGLGISARGGSGPRLFRGEIRVRTFEQSRDYSGVPRCRYCGKEITLKPGQPNTMHVDHFEPHSRGGPTTDANATPSCPTCNLRKYKMTISEFAKKMLTW
jgi:RHS repeat-associated protein